jgi:hypothetical protein
VPLRLNDRADLFGISCLIRANGCSPQKSALRGSSARSLCLGTARSGTPAALINPPPGDLACQRRASDAMITARRRAGNVLPCPVPGPSPSRAHILVSETVLGAAEAQLWVGQVRWPRQLPGISVAKVDN